MNDIEIYTLPSCPFCIKAKKLLASQGFEYNEHDISENEEEMRTELSEKFGLSSLATVPQITINGKYVGGYTDLERLFKTGEIKNFLNA